MIFSTQYHCVSFHPQLRRHAPHRRRLAAAHLQAILLVILLCPLGHGLARSVGARLWFGIRLLRSRGQLLFSRPLYPIIYELIFPPLPGNLRIFYHAGFNVW